MAKTKRRKYDPSRTRQQLQADVLTNTFFYHGSMIESVGALCGNFKYRLTDDSAAWILSRKNTWSGVALVFCTDANGNPYTKPRYFTYEKPITRAELDKRIEQEQLALLSERNMNQVCSTGYFIMPDHTLDMTVNRETITRLFERETPYDYTVTVLAAMSREAQLNKENQEAA